MEQGPGFFRRLSETVRERVWNPARDVEPVESRATIDRLRSLRTPVAEQLRLDLERARRNR